jgi:hypothetical protein
LRGRAVRSSRRETLPGGAHDLGHLPCDSHAEPRANRLEELSSRRAATILGRPCARIDSSVAGRCHWLLPAGCPCHGGGCCSVAMARDLLGPRAAAGLGQWRRLVSSRSGPAVPARIPHRRIKRPFGWRITRPGRQSHSRAAMPPRPGLPGRVGLGRLARMWRSPASRRS